MSPLRPALTPLGSPELEEEEAWGPSLVGQQDSIPPPPMDPLAVESVVQEETVLFMSQACPPTAEASFPLPRTLPPSPLLRLLVLPRVFLALGEGSGHWGSLGGPGPPQGQGSG